MPDSAALASGTVRGCGATAPHSTIRTEATAVSIDAAAWQVIDTRVARQAECGVGTTARYVTTRDQ